MSNALKTPVMAKTRRAARRANDNRYASRTLCRFYLPVAIASVPPLSPAAHRHQVSTEISRALEHILDFFLVKGNPYLLFHARQCCPPYAFSSAHSQIWENRRQSARTSAKRNTYKSVTPCSNPHLTLSTTTTTNPKSKS